jgi:rubrerythrin
MSTFKPSEIFQFAIQIEKNGEQFYRHMAQKFEEPEVKDLFSALANEEVKHKAIYEKMVSTIEEYEPFESYPEEYFNYLRAYADTHIFTPKKLDEEMARINDATSALKFAIDRELDSILYYQEVKNFVPKNERNLIDKIIEEERRHFMKLSSCKASHDAACLQKE